MVHSKYLKVAIGCTLMLSHAFVFGQQSSPIHPTEGPVQSDLLLTVRLSPNVKSETVELLNQVTVPRTLRLERNEEANRVFAAIYGSFFPRIEARLKTLNPVIGTQDLNTLVVSAPVEIKLPAGAEYYSDVLKPAGAKSDFKLQARLETGSDAKDLVNQIRKRTGLFKNYFKNYCKGHSCTSLQKVSFASQKAIAFPYVSRYVSFKVKPEAIGQISAILSQLNKDEGVVDAEVHSPTRLISHISSAEMALNPPCGVLPTVSEWFIGSVSLDKLPLEVLQGHNEVTISIMDSGIALDDKRFILWQNIPEVNGFPKQDDDRNGYVDDTIGCNFITQSDFPFDDQFSPDFHSHGTHVAGLASGRFLSEPLAQAVSQRVRAMILKIADSNGYVDNGAVNDAIVYSQSKNAAVVNMSFEGDFSASIKKYIKEDQSRVYVVAAGNGGLNKQGLDLEPDGVRRFPAKLSRELDNVISVAAHNDNGELACFSNFGKTTVDLAAPGVEIQSTIIDGGLLKLSGTSQAAPLVSLTAALLRSQGLAEPSLIKQRILVSVDFMPEYRGKLSSEGKLNVTKALSIFDDVIELNDAERTILRGKLLSPVELKVGERLIPFKAIKKIVNFSLPNGETLQRITLLDRGKLEHLYESFSLPNLIIKVGDTCVALSPEQIREIIPRLVATSKSVSCPDN